MQTTADREASMGKAAKKSRGGGAARAAPAASLPGGWVMIGQLARQLGVTNNTIEKRAAQLDPPPVRAGRTILLTQAQADAIAAALQAPGKRGPKPGSGA